MGWYEGESAGGYEGGLAGGYAGGYEEEGGCEEEGGYDGASTMVLYFVLSLASTSIRAGRKASFCSPFSLGVSGGDPRMAARVSYSPGTCLSAGMQCSCLLSG